MGRAVRLLPILLLGLVMTGCFQSGRCRVTVANAMERSIRSAVLVDTAGHTYTFGSIKPHSAASYMPVNNVLGKGLVLWIVDDTGTNVNRTVNLEPAVAPSYRGRLLFQIEGNAQVRTFFLPSEDASGSSMPWNVAPSWQGTIAIPGMPSAGQY